MTHTQPGKSHPLGATINPGGVNFSLFSKNCTGVELLLFEHAEADAPSQGYRLDPAVNRTGYYWHIFVPGIGAGQLYGWRLEGPNRPEEGLRFDGDKVLLDPYGRGVTLGKNYNRALAARPGSNAHACMKSVVVDPRSYNWEGDQPLKRPIARTVIYEMHVAGFTRHPNSGISPEKRGTYAGLIEKIPYLQSLGITAVELLPVFQFDPQDAPPGLLNYWGYSPVSFFAPHAAYSSRQDPLGPVDEFRDMVKALHRAGIEVILDVVYNHTAENGADGPTLCFRGLENRAYYLLEADRARYVNFSGCGNTINANHSIVRRMVMDSLRHWVHLMHVDGFRFDLASILSRDEQGNPLPSPPLLWDIESDPVLAGVKLIAEAWDVGGLYQVGSFLGDFFMEWNGRFRDDVRSFWKGNTGAVQRISQRLLGSPDLYGHEDREPEQSVNFVACHDGFTLNDVVSYSQKHNQANGEDNRDGSDYNLSWNCGAEGPTDDPEIESLRNRQVKNFLATVLLSIGVPMIGMGDEVRRTQRGNNNAYGQDNEISWFDWSLLETHADILEFTQKLIQLRLSMSLTQRDEQDASLNEILRGVSVTWHGTKLNQPDWSEHSHSLALTVSSLSRRHLFHIMLNAYWEALEFELPLSPTKSGWKRVLDTWLVSSEDVLPPDSAPAIIGNHYLLQPRSLVVLAARHSAG
ncbi:MAG: glycogen debranching protein GlgX [Anaerolineales bacterium]